MCVEDQKRHTHLSFYEKSEKKDRCISERTKQKNFVNELEETHRPTLVGNRATVLSRRHRQLCIYNAHPAFAMRRRSRLHSLFSSLSKPSSSRDSAVPAGAASSSS